MSSPTLAEFMRAWMTEQWKDPEWRAMVSEAVAQANRERIGFTHSEETKQKIAAALTGHEVTTESRDKISQTLRMRGVPEGTVVPEGMKFCRGCERVLSLSNFHKLSKARDGKQSKCKECRKALVKRRNAPTTEGEKACTGCCRNLDVSMFHKRAGSPDGLAYLCKECVKEKGERWYGENAERARSYTAQWQRDNPDKANAKNHRRRARVLAAPGDGWTADQWQALVAHYAPDGRCLACGKKRKLTVDHVVMLQDGGTNDITNLQPLCRSCNSKQESRDYRPDGGEFARGLV